MESLKIKAGEALKRAALNESAKNYLLQNPVLFNLLLKGARRYIGGENLEETILTAKKVNAKGFPVSIEFMGENVSSVQEANEATQEFLNITDSIKKENLRSIVSLDLSHIGLAIDKDLALNNLERLAQATQNSNTELIISAEGVDKTDRVLDTFMKISPFYPAVGITIQAYLHRTPDDLQKLLKVTQGKIRMVKGAFAASEKYALPRGEKLDIQFVSLVKTLLLNKRRCSIATHHDKIQEELKEFIRQQHFSSADYEFEMLYGIREDLLKKLKEDGFPARQYIVYGQEWYLYLCNRIAENPDNLFQFVIDITSNDKELELQSV